MTYEKKSFLAGLRVGLALGRNAHVAAAAELLTTSRAAPRRALPRGDGSDPGGTPSGATIQTERRS